MKKESKNLKSITERNSNDKVKDVKTITLVIERKEIDLLYTCIKALRPITNWLTDNYEKTFKN